MTIAKLARLGASSDIALPDDILTAANAQPGDEVQVTVTPEGIIEIAPRKQSVERQLDAARDIAKRYSAALRELAK